MNGKVDWFQVLCKRIMEGEWFFGNLWFGFIEQKPNLQGQVKLE